MEEVIGPMTQTTCSDND